MEGRMKTRARGVALVVAIGALALGAGTMPAAAKCLKVGGWGTGALEGIASFMAEAAMKNAAKAKLGEGVKIGSVAKKCGVKTVLYECTAYARACR
jgi:hypothetical protein